MTDKDFNGLLDSLLTKILGDEKIASLHAGAQQCADLEIEFLVDALLDAKSNADKASIVHDALRRAVEEISKLKNEPVELRHQVDGLSDTISNLRSQIDALNDELAKSIRYENLANRWGNGLAMHLTQKPEDFGKFLPQTVADNIDDALTNGNQGNGDKIKAIKIMRNYVYCGLLESKCMVESRMTYLAQQSQDRLYEEKKLVEDASQNSAAVIDEIVKEINRG